MHNVGFFRERLTRLLSAATALMLLAGLAKADVVYTLTTNSKGDAATAYFKAVTGGFEIIVTNTEANTPGSANAISQFQFTIGGALSTPTAFTEISGNQITYPDTGAGTPTGFVDYKPPSLDPNLHWSLDTSGSPALVDVSSPTLTGPGGQPQEMIVALNSVTTDNSLSNFNPSFNGSANFFLAASSVPANLTTAEITSVSFSFGTGPEDKLQPGVGTNVPPVGIQAVPEPSTLIAGGMGALVGLCCWLRRRKTPMAATTA